MRIVKHKYESLLDGDVQFKNEYNIYESNVDSVDFNKHKILYHHLYDIVKYFFMNLSCRTNNNDIAVNTAHSYNSSDKKIIISNDDIKKYLTKEKHMQVLVLHANIDYIISKNKIDSFDELFDEESPEESLEESLEEQNMTKVQQAINKFEKEGSLITKLDSDLYADIIKLSDKYSIRLGDGKYFVASDNIKVSFRDPSANPSWASWFMEAVPLASVPDRVALFFIPPEEREKHFPKQLEDNPIICHASLWKLGNQTGVLFHTSWCHIAASYKWKIDKPFDIASIMFRSVSHPAHIARNFGFAPQLVIPGDQWF
jgi:hypothetical protein